MVQHYIVYLKLCGRLWPARTFQTESGAKNYVNSRINDDISLEESDFVIDIIDHENK